MSELAEEVVEAGPGIRFRRKASDAVPVLDFSPMLSGRTEDRRRLADELRTACIDVGFFYLKNHGFPKAVIRNTHRRHFRHQHRQSDAALDE